MKLEGFTPPEEFINEKDPKYKLLEVYDSATTKTERKKKKNYKSQATKQNEANNVF